MRLGSLWEGPWPYPPQDGVGIRLEGVPTDWRGLVDYMQSKSCNPIAARRLADGLTRGEVRFTTLRSEFNFERMATDFASFGVVLRIVPPVPPKNPDHASEDYAELRRRLADGSLTREEIGPYAHLADKVHRGRD